MELRIGFILYADKGLSRRSEGGGNGRVRILHSRVTPSPISTSDLRPWTLDLEFDVDCDNREMLSKVSSVM